MTQVPNAFKIAARKEIAQKLKNIPKDLKILQSDVISKKVISSQIFKASNRISVYLSTDEEVGTLGILEEAFRLKKKIFVPSYKGSQMEMLRLRDLRDYEELPLTKWNIKQPNIDDESRENALCDGGIDLFIIPGVGFTTSGARLGHGMGFYDKYLKRFFESYPDKRGEGMSQMEKVVAQKTALIALAFKEQIVDSLPLEPHDYILDDIFTV